MTDEQIIFEILHIAGIDPHKLREAQLKTIASRIKLLRAETLLHAADLYRETEVFNVLYKLAQDMCPGGEGNHE